MFRAGGGANKIHQFCFDIFQKKTVNEFIKNTSSCRRASENKIFLVNMVDAKLLEGGYLRIVGGV